MKTCEEYVLKQLQITQEHLKQAEAKIKELEMPKVETLEEKDMNCIYLSDKPNYFYSVNTRYEWDWNDILRKNKKTPKFVEDALTDENKFRKLCSLKKENYSSAIGEVRQNIYNYLLKTRSGDCVIVLSSDNIYSYQLDKKEYSNFSKEEDAIKYRDEKVRKSINLYLQNYKDKFEETK